MAPHSHYVELANGDKFTIGNGRGSGVSGIPSGESGWGSISEADWIHFACGSTGGGNAHNNIAPAKAVYAWLRTA